MILLDTHILVWLAQDPAKLSRTATAAIKAAGVGGGLAISSITVWELAQLATRGRINVSGTVEAFVETIVSRTVVLPISPKIAAIASQLPDSYPRDPVDRLIGATALAEGVLLLTADANIRQSKAVRTTW